MSHVYYPGSSSQHNNVPSSSTSMTPTRNSLESPAVMNDMKKNMTDELEQRRLAWEQDVAKLQQDFFKTKLGNTAAVGNSGSGPFKSDGSVNIESSQASNKPTSFTVAPKDSDVYRLRFNLSGYAPEEISIRAEGYLLIVSAKHMEGDESQRIVTRNFNKQVDIPENVQLEKIISYLSKDGTLTVEAPWYDKATSLMSTTIPIAQSNRVTAGNVPVEHIRGYQSPPTYHTENKMHILPTQQKYSSLQPSYQASSIAANLPSFPTVTGNPFIFDTEYGRMLKLNVDLGRTDYQPSEVKVIVGRNKISLAALHEEVKNGRTTRREFKREFEIPEPIEMSTLRAVLDVKTGQVFIGASFISNMKHSMVSYIITQHMPLFGRPVIAGKY